MKGLKCIIFSATLLASSLVALAQTGIASGTPYGSGQDSIRCRENISLFSTYVKSESYTDAYEFWKKAYAECPGSSKNIYISGVKILNWQIQQETDPAKRAAKVEELMKLYDDRAKYFGDDPRYGLDWITASKVTDYLQIVPKEKVDYDKIYGWTKPVIEKIGGDTDAKVVYFNVYSSLNKAIGNEAWHQQYINDYMSGNDIMEKAVEAAEATGDTVRIEYVRSLKGQLDMLFVQSGLAKCDMLVKIYGKDLEANKENIAFLQAMLDMFRNADCEKDPLYFKASKYLFAIKPTAASALGLAKEAMSANKNAEATEFLNKAISLTSDKNIKASCYYTLAVMSMNARQYSQSRAYCQKAMDENPSMGGPLILIAKMYAATASSIFPGDALKQRCVFYLVLDKLERARSIDSRVAGEAASLIAQYRRHLPSSSDVFMHPELDKGKSFYVGGWIGESTTIR